MGKFKEIFLIVLSVILMFGGLGVIVTAELANGIMVLGAVAIAAGLCIFIYLMRNAMVEHE